MIKIVSWNVNSVRVRLPHLLELIDSVKPDVILLQETKTEDQTFPKEDLQDKGNHKWPKIIQWCRYTFQVTN